MAAKEAAESAISYSVGGASIILAHCIESAQIVTVVCGVLIVIIRLVYDAIKLYRLFKGSGN